MKVSVALVAGILVVLSAEKNAGESLMKSPMELPLPKMAEEGQEVQRREGRIFAFITTTSIKRLATTTISVPYTCLSVKTTTTCTGRKKKSTLSQLLDLIQDSPPSLAASLDYEKEENLDVAKREVTVDGDGRVGRKLTIWSTYASTLTVTSTSYITGTTVTISALCTAPGITAGCFGK
ncbi:uncharacterized protein [Cherax quadricarinatus]|uniref:uncharacterized protein n=1 Tax=Cherax quadricarinatus TaxID=27406 RepID=UPI00387E9139